MTFQQVASLARSSLTRQGRWFEPSTAHETKSQVTTSFHSWMRREHMFTATPVGGMALVPLATGVKAMQPAYLSLWLRAPSETRTPGRRQG